MIFSTDDDPRGRPGLDFSTEESSGVEESKAAASSTTMISTSASGGKAQVQTMIAPKVELCSSKVGTNNRAFSRLPIADQHLIIAKQMDK